MLNIQALMCEQRVQETPQLHPYTHGRCGENWTRIWGKTSAIWRWTGGAAGELQVFWRWTAGGLQADCNNVRSCPFREVRRRQKRKRLNNFGLLGGKFLCNSTVQMDYTGFVNAQANSATKTQNQLAIP